MPPTSMVTSQPLLTPRKLPVLDGVRGVAALSVLLYHFPFQAPELALRLKDVGQSGVQLFYILSAFTLALSLDKRSTSVGSAAGAPESQREAKIMLRYTIRRLFRIAPLYWTALTAYLMVEGAGPRFWSGFRPLSLANIIASYTFLAGLSPSWINSIIPGQWSIAVETTFYACLPWLFSKLCSARRLFCAILGSFVLALLADASLKQFPPAHDRPLWNSYIHFWFPGQLPIFLLGILMFQLYRNPQCFARPSLGTGPWPLGLALGGVFQAVSTHVLRILPTVDRILNHYLVSGILLFIICLNALAWKTGPLTTGIARFMGRISYSTYLWHNLIIYCFVRHWYPTVTSTLTAELGEGHALSPVRAAIVLISIYTFSTISYYGIEFWGIKAGERLIARFVTRNPNRTVSRPESLILSRS